MSERKRVGSFKVKHNGTGTIHDVFVYEVDYGDSTVQVYETGSGMALRKISENQFEMKESKARFTRA